MSGWQPTAQGLADVAQFLREAMNPTDNKAVYDKLAYFNNVPDFNSYLVYILTRMPQEDQYLRSIAGLTLKNNIRLYLPHIPGEVMAYIKEACLQHIGDADMGKAVGYVIAAILRYGKVERWPQALQVLVNKLDSPNPVETENAFSALHKICEDCSEQLDTVINGVSPLDHLIPKFISFFSHPNVKIRTNAIICTSLFVPLRSQALMSRMNDFLNALFSHATDDSLDVRKAVCRALVSVLEICPSVLFPQMPNLVEYLLFCTQSDDPDLALEACEFWLVFAEAENLRKELQPYLGKVLPVMLKGMVYSEDDLLTLGGDEDDAHIADGAQDIKPRFHKANVIEVERASRDDLDEGSGDKKKKAGGEDDEDDEEEDDDDDLDDDELYGEWNLRKCSAATLDALCIAFGGEAVHFLMPLLKIELESDDWLHRECGILALGAAAEGGILEIAPHLPELVPYLLRNLNDPKPLVRSITCWTLGRFAAWIVRTSTQNPEAHKHLFEPLIQLLLQRILDNNKRVQEAACSSFALIEEEADEMLVPYLQPILMTFATAFNKYQTKNLIVLYDTVGTLADVIGGSLNTPQCIETIMPPLIRKWQEISDDDADIFPLLECLSSITMALGKGFKPFAEPVYRRCVHLVCKTLQACQVAAVDSDAEVPDKDFMIVSLDLLSGIVQALNTDVEPLVASTNPPVVQFLAVCIQDNVPEVRQSAYALLGDMAISCFEHLRPVISQFMPHVISQIDPQAQHVSVCNNATWAAGEIALKWGAEIRPSLEPLLERLFPLMTNPNIQRTLLENVAITIGRLGLTFPDIIAPHLEMFIHPWLLTLTPIRDNEEKASAFSGLCAMIQLNPQGAVKAFPALCAAIAKYMIMPPSLEESFQNILMGYKGMFGEQWQQVLASVPSEAMPVLMGRYNIEQK